MKEGFAGYVN